MKIRNVLCSAAALATLAAPAFAQTPVYRDLDAPAYPVERIYVPGERDHGALHGGTVAPGDEVLLSDVMNAISSDRRIQGSTVTIVANNGELKLDGNARNNEEAQRIEQIAKRVARGRSTAFFSAQSG
jgi:hypothetical protein